MCSSRSAHRGRARTFCTRCVPRSARGSRCGRSPGHARIHWRTPPTTRSRSRRRPRRRCKRCTNLPCTCCASRSSRRCRTLPRGRSRWCKVPERLLVVGDALLDRDLDGAAERLAPDAPVPVVRSPTRCMRPGGAALAALLAARDGAEVTLLTALGGDDAGEELATLLDREEVTVVDLVRRGRTPIKTRV